MATKYDAIFVGAGHNALFAAANLAENGWKVLVLERNAEAGGALRSAEILGEGYHSDLYATNLNLVLGHAGYNRWKDRLAAKGVEFVTSDKPFANVYPDGTAIKAYRDFDKTLESFTDPGDKAGFRELHKEFGHFAESMMPLYGTPMPTARTATVALNSLRKVGMKKFLELATIILSSTRELGDRYFTTDKAKALIASWGMHMDFGPEVSGGGMFPFMEVFSDVDAGISITRGGAQHLIDGLVSLIEDFGGTVEFNSEVAKINTTDGTATGVTLADGTFYAAERVIATAGPDALYNTMLADAPEIDAETRTLARRYQYGPGTMMIHFAMDRPVPWTAGEDLSEFAYVHVGPYVEDMSRTYYQAINGILPDHPSLVVGQSSSVDPTRAPEGKHVLWVQVRALPYEAKSDANGEITPGDWDDMKEAYADRIADNLEALAPGFKESVDNRVVLSPKDLWESNPNLVRGDSVGGSHHVMQMFLFRPWVGASTYETPIDNVNLIGAATWPGGGLNGNSGWFLSEKLLSTSVGEKISGVLERFRR